MEITPLGAYPAADATQRKSIIRNTEPAAGDAFAPSATGGTGPEGFKEMKNLAAAARILSRGHDMDLDKAASAVYGAQDWQAYSQGHSVRAAYDPVHQQYYIGKVGSEKEDQKYSKKYLTALDREGKELWSFSGGGSMTCEPVTDNQGNVYVRSRDTLTCLDPEGRKLWDCSTTDLSTWGETLLQRPHEDYSQGNPFNKAPLTGPDGTVYVLAATDCIGGDNLRVMAVREGKELWSHAVPWSGEKGPEIKIQGDHVYVSHLELKEYEETKKGFFVTRVKTVTKSVDCLDCLNRDGTIKYSAAMNEPELKSYSDSPCNRPFAVGPDGSAYKMKDANTIQSFSPEGKPGWTFRLQSGAGLQPEGTWLVQTPVVDNDGNIYLVGCERFGNNPTPGVASNNAPERSMNTRIIMLNREGLQQYDCTIGNRIPEAIDPLITGKGEMAAVVRESREGPAHLVVLNAGGKIRGDYKLEAPGDSGVNRSIIWSIAMGDDEILVEKAGNHGNNGRSRSIVAVPLKIDIDLDGMEQEIEEKRAAEEVQITDNALIIDGIKLGIKNEA